VALSTKAVTNPAVVGYSYQELNVPHSPSQVEYLANTRVGEKGQLTIPKQYRDELGLNTGAPVAVLRGRRGSHTNSGGEALSPSL
jgi:AbrB family looped-hinge helix DNA binding protein